MFVGNFNIIGLLIVLDNFGLSVCNQGHILDVIISKNLHISDLVVKRSEMCRNV